jgi:hypothetical protein
MTRGSATCTCDVHDLPSHVLRLEVQLQEAQHFEERNSLRSQLFVSCEYLLISRTEALVAHAALTFKLVVFCAKVRPRFFR